MLVATTRALATETEVLAGFEAGADAYLTAPLSAEELCARAVAQRRRLSPSASAGRAP